jgi:hypothetical protein
MNWYRLQCHRRVKVSHSVKTWQVYFISHLAYFCIFPVFLHFLLVCVIFSHSDTFMANKRSRVTALVVYIVLVTTANFSAMWRHHLHQPQGHLSDHVTQPPGPLRHQPRLRVQHRWPARPLSHLQLRGARLAPGLQLLHVRLRSAV